ncbi:MAG: hypothetical protein ACJ8AW_49375 [Rhodopila sp.]
MRSNPRAKSQAGDEDSTQRSFPQNLVQNDKGEWDVGDALMIVVSTITVFLFFKDSLQLWSTMELTASVDLPKPTDVLTYALGGSLGGYLAKRSAAVSAWHSVDTGLSLSGVIRCSGSRYPW